MQLLAVANIQERDAQARALCPIVMARCLSSGHNDCPAPHKMLLFLSFISSLLPAAFLPHFRTYVVAEHVLLGADFDGIGDKAEDRSHPEEHRESAEKVLAELDPFRRRPGRRQSVRPVALEDGLGLRCSQALQKKD